MHHSPPLPQPKILVVDDDPAMLRLLVHWLRGEEKTVLTAQDGRMAQELMRQHSPAVLLTDWEIPICDGLELCRWIRQQNFPQYVYKILITAGSHAAAVGLDAGADDFIRKPVDKSELLARVRAGLRVIDLESRLLHLAKSDPLTGLPTKRTLDEEIQREWSRSRRYRLPLSCIMVDIDYFKRVNDVYGHAAGDAVIRRVAGRLSQGSRTSDFVARYGGEEYCVLLPETNESDAACWAERMREELAQTPFHVGEKQLKITTSFGVASCLSNPASAKDLIELADQALLAAKRLGRNRVVRFQSLLETSQYSAMAHATKVFDGVLARDVMTAIVGALNQSGAAGTAAQYFLRYRISSAPVVDDRGELVGVLSEKDVMSIMLQPRWWIKSIHEVMNKNLVSYDEDAPAMAVYEFLSRAPIEGVVIAHENHPTGFITRGSLVRWFINRLVRQAPSLLEANAGSVQGKHESDRIPRSGGESGTASQDAWRRVLETARALVQQARGIEQRFETPSDQPASELVPCVVSGASRMQDLINELLACTRYLNDPADSTMLDVQATLPDQNISPSERESPSDDLHQGLPIDIAEESAVGEPGGSTARIAVR